MGSASKPKIFSAGVLANLNISTASPITCIHATPVVGLAVPGMPIGSPGMEGPNPQPYEVFTFDKQGQTTVYARR
jgi:hypothetical protein